MDLKNKVVVVTGGSSGIGAATAIEFSKVGARVVIVGRNKEKLNNVAAQCNDPLVICADIVVENEAVRVIQETINKFGQLDVLVNNAGVGAHRPIVDGNLLEIYDRVMNTNFRSVVHLTSLAVPYLIKTKGNIINVSSIGGLKPVCEGMSLYSASKGALNMFTLSTAAELSSYGVRANIVCPGPVKTNFAEASGLFFPDDFAKNMKPPDRISEPEEIADLIIFLASEKAKGITGSNFLTDNGTLVKFSM